MAMAAASPCRRFDNRGISMSRTIRTLTLACAVVVGTLLTSAHAAEREQVRMVINLLSSVKMPFPRNLQNNLSRTERVQLDTNGATAACLRLDDKVRWCYEHVAPVGARAEMLRITMSQWLACWSVSSTTMLTTSIWTALSTSAARPGSMANRMLRLG